MHIHEGYKLGPILSCSRISKVSKKLVFAFLNFLVGVYYTNQNGE